MKTAILVFFCFLICLSSAYSADKDTVRELQGTGLPAAGELTDPQQVIRVGSGEKFVIILDSNATTGYSWRAPERTSFVSLNSHRYEAPQSSMPGAGGREHFEFTAQSAGKESLIFQYSRPWEKDIPPAKTATFTVEVISKIKKK